MDTNKLRQKILDLAIHGKLVPQDPNDEPASVLIERIKAEKVSKNPSDKRHYENIIENVPFEVPEGWCWKTLGEVGIWQAGGTPSRTHKEYYGGNIPWLKTGDLNDGYITDIPEFITEEAVSNSSAKLNPSGSVLIAMYGATIGKLGILTFPATTNQACCACIKYEGIEQKYLFYFLMHNKKKFIRLGGGGAQPNISKEIIVKTMFPIPPINEQKRIVAKVEDLFSLIYELDTSEDELNNSILSAKSKILDLAIRGKLVPQDPDDEPASELLKRINPNLSTSCDNPHYESLPQTWECLKLKDVCQLQDGIKAEGNHIILDAKYLRGRTSGTLCNKGKLVKKGELQILVDGENSGEVFTAPCDGYMGSTFKKLCINNELYAPYILYFITLHKDMLRNSKKGAAIPHLNKEIFYNLIIGIPPFEEQKRIASKIKSLFETLDTIKSLIN